MSPAEQLRAAKALIDTPEKWTQGCAARDADGLSSGVCSGAVCWCAWGALAKFGNPFVSPGLINLMDGAVPDDSKSFITYNDLPTTTYADVMALFDRAIDAAEKADA